MTEYLTHCVNVINRSSYNCILYVPQYSNFTSIKMHVFPDYKNCNKFILYPLLHRRKAFSFSSCLNIRITFRQCKHASMIIKWSNYWLHAVNGSRNRKCTATKLLLLFPINPTDAAVHDNVIKWKHIPRNWPFVRGIHRSPVNSLHKGQWREALMFSLICVWINDWVINREAGDLRRYRAHYHVIVMWLMKNA